VEPVQETVVWMVRNKDYIGTVDIRHRLNWHLEKWGGHVHFVIRPSLRGSGLGEIMLRKALPIINYIGIDEALFTVDLDNSWAIHILEKLINELGGQFEDETPATDKFPAQRRYWLNCS
ncbi:MAG: GNAT family N-acetyltransferase, partial [Pseudomonadota bacterium]